MSKRAPAFGNLSAIADSVDGSPRAGRAAAYARMSTEHQQYSISNQLETIRQFANSRQLRLVRTYVDPGRSGLNLSGRPGLRALLHDVESGRADYSTVLVYDVSRWGRFQNTDESAFYDFTCRVAGVRVIYCAEPFEGYSEMMAALAKSLKRAMAGEFSREMSVKTWHGCSTLALRGFKLGGPTAFGLRRLLVDETRYPKMVLQRGDRKALQTDRVILIPGPREEVEVVWQIFDLYVHTDMYIRQIAAVLNKGKVTPPLALRWNTKWVRGVLKAQVYTGDYVWNKLSAKLGSPQNRNPPDQWVRCERAFLPLVTRELFESAQDKLRIESHPQHTVLELKRKLEKAFQKHKHLSAGILYKEYAIAPTTYSHYFGSLRRAYEAVGYCPILRQDWTRNRAAAKAIRSKLIAAVIESLDRAGMAAQSDLDRGLLIADSRFKIYVRIARSHFNQRRGYCWHISFPAGLECDFALLAGLDHQNEEIDSLFFIPGPALTNIPGNQSSAAKPIRQYRIKGLDELCCQIRLSLDATKRAVA